MELQISVLNAQDLRIILSGDYFYFQDTFLGIWPSGGHLADEAASLKHVSQSRDLVRTGQVSSEELSEQMERTIGGNHFRLITNIGESVNFGQLSHIKLLAYYLGYTFHSSLIIMISHFSK